MDYDEKLVLEQEILAGAYMALESPQSSEEIQLSLDLIRTLESL